MSKILIFLAKRFFMPNNLSIPEDYHDFLIELKERIRNAQVRAALSINREFHFR